MTYSSTSSSWGSSLTGQTLDRQREREHDAFEYKSLDKILI